MRSNTLSSLVLCAALLVLSGCASIARSGPGETSISPAAADLAGFSLIEMTAANVRNYVVVRASDSAGTAGIPQAPRISLSAGDVLRIKIAESKAGGLFAPLATGGTPFEQVRVDDKGTISLPYTGRVKVLGLDTQQVEDRLRARLAGVAFEPQVFVELVSGRAASVLVSGEVRNPGRFSMLEGPLTLIDAINRAGGAVRPPHQVDVVIRRGNKVIRVSLATVQGGRNQELQPGDEVILEADTKTFNALGAVNKTGQMEFSKPDPTLLDALAQAGGLLDATASTTGVFVFRLSEARAWQGENGQWQAGPVIFKFNMSKPETLFLAQVFGMRPDDTIYVTNAPAVEWVKALTPIALTLSMVRNGVETANVLDVINNRP